MQRPVLLGLLAALILSPRAFACHTVSFLEGKVTTTDSSLLETAMHVDFAGRSARSKGGEVWALDRTIASETFFFPVSYSADNSFPVRYMALFGPVVCVSSTDIKFCSTQDRPAPDSSIPCSMHTSDALCATADETLVLPAHDMSYSLPPVKTVSPTDSEHVCVDTLHNVYWTEETEQRNWFALFVAFLITFVGRMMFSPWDWFDKVGIGIAAVGAIVVFVISSLKTTHLFLSLASAAYCVLQFGVLLASKPRDASGNSKEQTRARIHSRGIVLISTCIICLAISKGFAFSVATIFAFRSWKHMFHTLLVARTHFKLLVSVVADISILLLWGLETVPATVSSVSPPLAIIVWTSVTLLAATSVVAIPHA
jgi:hypothetical protein